VLAINSAEIGETIYVGYTASYVTHLENGHSKRAPSGFIALTALEWPQIVRESIVKAKAVSAASGGSLARASQGAWFSPDSGRGGTSRSGMEGSKPKAICTCRS